MTSLPFKSSISICRRTTLLNPGIFNANSATFAIQKRSVMHTTYGASLPRPPPRAYEPDGSLVRYRTNAQFYDHGISWIKWEAKTCGFFHIYYEGYTAEELPARNAYREQFRQWIFLIPLYISCMIMLSFFTNAFTFGIKPQNLTADWAEAARERDRAENSYPFTRYLDRRRKERGPHWLYGKYLPQHSNFLWQSNHRDTAFLRAKALKARAQWLQEEERRAKLEAEESEDGETLSADKDVENLEDRADDMGESGEEDD